MKNIILLATILVLHLFILSNLTFTAWPEMFSYPYLFSKGFKLYKDFILPYPPGLIFLLTGLFNLFGYSILVLKVMTWTLILAEDTLLYFIFRKVASDLKQMFLLLLIFVFVQSFLDGNQLWFDFATVIPTLLGFSFLLSWIEKGKKLSLFLASLCLSISILIKQTSLIYFVIFLLFYFLLKKRIIYQELGTIFLGLVVGLMMLFLYLLSISSFPEFWNWVIYYPLFKWSQFPGYVIWEISRKEATVFLILVLPLLIGFLKIRNFYQNKIFLISFLFVISSIIAIYPRFTYFHLQPLLVFSILLSATIGDLLNKKIQKLYLVLVIISLTFVIFLIIKQELGKETRFYSEQEKNLAKEIKQYSNIDDKVFLLGPISSEYVFSSRVPPKHWSDNFGWYLEIPGVQDWILEEFIADPPKVIFRKTPQRGAWYELATYQPKKIVDFIYLNYQRVDNRKGDTEIWTRND